MPVFFVCAGLLGLLILKDENDPENHLRQFCIAIGSAIPPTGVDPATITDTANTNYRWYAPEAPSILPPNIFFIPPLADSSPVSAITAPPQDNGAAGSWSGLGRRSVLPPIGDNPRSGLPDMATRPPTMRFEPINQPRSLSAAPHSSGRTWYYVELQPSGASNHLGKVVLVVAAGIARVVTAIEDPDPRVSGGGHAILERAGIACQTGLMADQARRTRELGIAGKRCERAAALICSRLSTEKY